MLPWRAKHSGLIQYTFCQLTSRPDAKGRCRILLDVTWNGQREKLPTGVSCQPAHFDANAKAEPGRATLNLRLTELVTDLADL